MGIIIGRYSAAFRSQSPVLTFAPDVRLPVPVVEIDDVRNQVLQGRVQGDVRVFVGTEPLDSKPDGTFVIPFNTIVPIERVQAPAGMQFVASNNGKLYYSLGDPRAEKLAADTRVYFQNAEQAEAQGYVPAK